MTRTGRRENPILDGVMTELKTAVAAGLFLAGALACGAAHLVFGRCLKPTAGALALLSIVACGTFSSDVTPVPRSTATSTSQPPTGVSQSSTPETADKSAPEGSELYRAVWTGDLETVKKLVAEGADANESDEEGNPLLHEAVWRGHTKVARALVDAGADVDARDSEGNPVLYSAIWRDHTEVARLLVDARADVNARDAAGNPLLYPAIWRDHLEITQILADAGADVDARDSDNEPLLYTAVWREKTEAQRFS